ncbi:MAG: CHAT domain-containing protein [Nocardioidaceae bacterium]
MTQLPWPATHSLLREELLDLPPAIFGDPRLDAPVQALIAGEPQRALALLAAQPPDPRSATALTAWARQLDRNWYPGDVGAETAVVTPDAFVEPQPTDHPVALQLAMLARRGPTDLRTPRTLLEMALRQGTTPGVRQALGYAAQSVDLLTQFATQTGQQAWLPWLTLVRADFSRRAGLLPDADALLAQARQQASYLQSPPRLALTYLTEGDWYAAPGSSPECLGWDLAPLNAPSPLPRPDLTRAATLWDQADALLVGWDVPRLRAALALRRAWQARLAGAPDTQRQYLRLALDLSQRAGDGATHQLAAVHQLVADVDDGLLAQHQLQLGGGWSPPQHGPVAGLLTWAATSGSRSWCVGLGRLLQRCGERWAAEGSSPRARVALLAALPLVGSEPSMPSRALQTAVAHVDSRLNLPVNALLRLDRASRTPEPDGGNPDYAFAQSLDAATSMVGALRDRSRGAAAGITADRMQLLRDELDAQRAATEQRLGPVAGLLPRTMAELQEAVVGLQGDGSLEASAEGAGQAVEMMVRMQLVVASSTVTMLDVLVATTRAEAAQRAGVPAEAERWYDVARERAAEPTADPFLPTLVELSAGRLDAAGAALAAAADQVSDDLQLPMWVRIGDTDRAATTLARLQAAGAPLSDWRSRLTIAELHLRQGDAAAARAELRDSTESFLTSIGSLLRDPDRLDACDQPDVAALFSLRALASLELGEVEDSLSAAEEARQLVTRQREAADDTGPWAEWQRAAADYAAVSTTVLARLAQAAPGDPAAPDFTALDAADARLAAAEHELDQRHPGILMRQAAPPPTVPVAELRGRLTEGAVCLEYLAVGDDLLVWAVTRDAVVPAQQRIRYRDLGVLVRAFHAACSSGHAPPEDAAGDLARLLLAPVTDTLRAHERVVVVPFGALHLVPFHALPFDGAPLGLTHVVSYAPSLAEAVADGGLDAPVDASHPLAVGDPAFDPSARPHLKDLPGSRLEATTVADLLGVADPLIGEAATEPAVTALLDDCTLLHISSHGHLDELSPFSSSLVMAGADELTVAELVGLRFGTSLAVLTGCDTGRGNATLGGDVVGLTRSLLRGGVRQVVVSLWPVDDWVAPVVMRLFYDGLRRGRPPAVALAEAQRAVHALDAPALRAAYVGMGGSGQDARRRGVELDPELRDEEDVPAPLGGDAERFWAPFVLVG